MKKILKRVAIGIATFVAVIVVISIAVGGGNSDTSVGPTPQVTAPATQPPSSSPATPSMTDSQEQAVESAQGYLSDGQGFSRYGLIQQLTSNAGEGFSHSDAEFAVNHLNPDWNAQAVMSAQGYLSDGQGFSRSGLLEQLTSHYGEGFTQAQAEYAVNQTMSS